MPLLNWLPLEYLLGMGAWLAALGIAAWMLLRWRQSRRRAKRSLRGPHVGLAVWMVLVALTAPELLCALFYDATDSFSQTNVSRRWFERHVNPNRAGYRDDRELPQSRLSHRKYVAFAGDSFTFGHGVRNVGDRFSDRVGRELKNENVVAFNVALPGVDIRQLVNALLLDFDQNSVPIDVLVYTFVPNDIEYLDERTAAFYQQRAGRDPAFFLWKNTYFYNLLYHRVMNWMGSKSNDYYGYLTASYEDGEPWDQFATKLKQLDGWCLARKAKLQVVIFPFLTSLGEHDRFLPAYAKMREHCREHNIPCVDLTPIMTAHQREGLVVSRFDAHPNERAHALAAEAIAPAVRDLLKP